VTPAERLIGPALALSLLGGCGPSAVPSSIEHPLAGRAAPPFSAVATNSRDVGLPALGTTRVTVIDFWASWCPLCRATLPSFASLYDDRRRDGILVIGVSIDESGTPAQAFMESIDARFPLVLDPHQRLASTYGVAQLPLTFVVDDQGRVRWVGRDPDDARDAAEVLLRESADGRAQAFE
jgi:cytochrome c biogenesis protein CcmG, thiol:disulfide interchange protein DsbE